MNSRIKDPNKAHYFEVFERDEFWETCPKLVKANAEVWIWEKGQGEDQLEKFSMIDIRPEKSMVILKKQGNFIHHLLGSDMLNKDVLFRIHDDKINYFSTSNLYKDPDNGKNYAMNLNEDIYISRQRRNYRLDASPTVPLKMKICDSVFNGIDVSAGGMMIKIPTSEFDRFPEGEEMENAIVQIGKKQFGIQKLKIAKTFRGENKDGTPKEFSQVGFQFLKVEAEEEMVTHINSEARGEEVRKSLIKK